MEKKGKSTKAAQKKLVEKNTSRQIYSNYFFLSFSCLYIEYTCCSLAPHCSKLISHCEKHSVGSSVPGFVKIKLSFNTFEIRITLKYSLLLAFGAGYLGALALG